MKTFTGPGNIPSDLKPDLLPGDAATPCGLIAKSLFNSLQCRDKVRDIFDHKLVGLIRVANTKALMPRHHPMIKYF